MATRAITQPKETSEYKSTNPISNRTKKRVKPRQYEQKPREKTNEQNEITACISLKGDVLSYVPLKFPIHQQRKALIDTGACANAISEKDYEDLKSSFGTSATISKPCEVSKVSLRTTCTCAWPNPTRIFSSKIFFQRTVLNTSNTNSILLGNPFFKNNSIELYRRENLMNCPT